MLREKVAVVTGAGRGNGRAVALALAAAGAKVVVNDSGEADGATAPSGAAFDVAAEIERAGGEAVANADAVASWDGAERIVGTAIERFGRLDVLVTCAAIRRDRAIFEMTAEEWHEVLAVELKGTFNCIRHAAPPMREQRAGRIVTFSAGAGLLGAPGQANHGAATSAIGGLTKVAAKDLGKYGITCNSICDLEGVEPEEVAPTVVFLASDRAAGVNGQFFSCAAGSVSLLSLPRSVKTIWKDGRWTLDELDGLVPRTLADGLAASAAARSTGGRHG